LVRTLLTPSLLQSSLFPYTTLFRSCPTDAFPAPFRLDARKCLAYYSVEHKGQIPKQFRKPMGNRVFGCDDCLAVCPWNKFARQTDRKSTRLNSSHVKISYAVFCLKK